MSCHSSQTIRCAFLKFERICIESFGKVLHIVEAQLGLKVSCEKTMLYRIGSLYRSNATLYTRQGFVWSNASLDTLGVKLNCDGSMNSENYDMVIVKLKSVCDTWYNRNLSLMGKIIVINTLMGSLFVYKLLTLGGMTTEQMDETNKIIKNYIWKGKHP